MMNIWSFIKEELEKKNNCILVVVLDRRGSSPGQIGYKMAIGETSEILGSIGGGIMEVNMVEFAKQMLNEKSSDIVIKKQVHNENADEENKSGLICAGEQTQVFIPLNNNNLKTITSINECMQKGKSGVLSLSPTGIFFFESENYEYNIRSSVRSKSNWSYSEVIGLKDTFYIFGGGHVSIPVSQIFNMLGFKVVVYDNREGLATLNNNNYAHHKEIINYDEAEKYVKPGKNSFVSIMTVSHAEDQAILKQMLSKGLTYLGMIGSKNKVKKIFENLVSEGIDREALEKVDAPMGIPINSKSIEEIAVSIAAKVINEKNSV